MSINIFTLVGLTAWLGRQDPDTEYNYTNNNDCLLCRYFHAHGVPLVSNGMFASNWYDTDGNEHRLSPKLNDVANDKPYTYGAALARANELVT